MGGSSDEDRFVPIHTVNDRFEADILMDAMKREGIPALLRSYQDTAYDGLFVLQKGWGQILAPEAHAARAHEIVDALAALHGSGRTYQDPSEIDPLLWEQLRQANPEEIARNALVGYDAERRGYVLLFLGKDFIVLPHENRIEPFVSTRESGAGEAPRLAPSAPASPAPPSPSPGAAPPSATLMPGSLFQFHLSVLHYLLEAGPHPPSGRWISEKELPGGSFFFRGLHELPTRGLLDRFGAAPREFRAAAERLGGEKAEGGDIAFRFQVLPRVPMLFIFWEGDEEFEPALHIHFDAGVGRHIAALESLWALTNVVAKDLAASA